MDEEPETVKLAYSSSFNISFFGWVDTGLTWEEWDQLSYEAKVEVRNEKLWELVDIDEVPRGEDPDRASSPHF